MATMIPQDNCGEVRFSCQGLIVVEIAREGHFIVSGTIFSRHIG
jgi:hypothetical protein